MTGLIGFLNLSKPPGMTSHDVVSRVRKILKVKQVGHAGTLDPMAIGVLPIAVGRACRLLRFLESDKVYVAEILLGTTTDTDDIQGQVLSRREARVSGSQLGEALRKYVGDIEQTPPIYSAVHVDGKRLYDLARKGEAPAPEQIPSRRVTVHGIEVLGTNLGTPAKDPLRADDEPLKQTITVRISCSSGTYIRSIARDLGADLGTGGCLLSLVREQAGSFELKDAISLGDLALSGTEALLPAENVLNLPKIEVSAEHAAKIAQGQAVQVNCRLNSAGESQPSNGDWAPLPNALPPESEYAVLRGGRLLAICAGTIVHADLKLSPSVVLRTPDAVE